MKDFKKGDYFYFKAYIKFIGKIIYIDKDNYSVKVIYGESKIDIIYFNSVGVTKMRKIDEEVVEILFF